MRRGTLEVQAVAGLEEIAFILVQPDFEPTAQDVKKLFAFVGVGLAAIATRLDAEQMRFHGGVAPGQKLHAHAFAGLEDLAFARFDHAGVFLRRLKERKNVRAVMTRDAAQGGDRSAHLAPFESAQEPDRNPRGFRYLSQRKAAALPEAAKAHAGRDRTLCGNGNHALALQDVNNRRGIETARATQEKRALQQPNVFSG